MTNSKAGERTGGGGRQREQEKGGRMENKERRTSGVGHPTTQQVRIRKEGIQNRER